MIDLGSGDGQFLITAAKSSDLVCSGIEINPDEYNKSIISLMRCPMAIQNRVHFYNQDFLSFHTEAENAYCCNTAFSIRLQIQLTQWLDAQASLERVFTLRPLIDSLKYTINSRFLVSCSWDNALCYEYYCR